MGEVGGAIPAPVVGSDDDTMYCGACVNKKASAYCLDCEDYLCPPCVDYHKKLRVLKDHRLLTGANMPSFYPARQSSGTATDGTTGPRTRTLTKTTGQATTSTERTPGTRARTIPKTTGQANTKIDLSRARFRRLEDIKVCTEPCAIYDTAIVSPGSLLVSNGTKQTIQLVNSRTGSTLSEVSTSPRGPKRICLMGGERAAVSMSDDKVQLVHVRGGRLTLGTVLGVKAGCWGVTSSGDNIVVSYLRPPWLEVMSTDGRVLHRFKESGAAQPFKDPDFLTTSSDGFTYAADCDEHVHAIIKFDSSLRVLQTFSDPQLGRPFGLTSVNSDTLLACNYDNDSIVHVNVNSGKVTTILGREDGIVRPYSLAFCPQQRKLFVCTYNKTDRLQVYQMH